MRTRRPMALINPDSAAFLSEPIVLKCLAALRPWRGSRHPFRAVARLSRDYRDFWKRARFPCYARIPAVNFPQKILIYR